MYLTLVMSGELLRDGGVRLKVGLLPVRLTPGSRLPGQVLRHPLHNQSINSYCCYLLLLSPGRDSIVIHHATKCSISRKKNNLVNNSVPWAPDGPCRTPTRGSRRLKWPECPWWVLHTLRFLDI